MRRPELGLAPSNLWLADSNSHAGFAPALPLRRLLQQLRQNLHLLRGLELPLAPRVLYPLSLLRRVPDELAVAGIAPQLRRARLPAPRRWGRSRVHELRGGG
eukprot:scaffold442_cov268-Pinguiococcus_pyrenoidosus.AAC.44